MAPPRWSRPDILWIVVVVMGICAGVCYADIATDGNSILTDDISETSIEEHTSPPTEDRDQGGLTSEFSTLAVSGKSSSKTTTSENSEITTSHDNTISETMETTTTQIGDNREVEPGKEVPADNNTNNIGERSENKPTYIKNAARQRSQNIVTAVDSPEDSTSRSKSTGKIVHVILFTSWQMIVAMIGLEVFVYCVTIFIIFGFGRQRSRAKRFGHFSWKRPGPLQLAEQETSFSTLASRDHHIGGAVGTGGAGGTEEPLMKTKHVRGMMKKPSVRGHRP